MSLIPGSIIDEGYKIIKPIGAGAMGSVYQASKWSDLYAIKESAICSSQKEKEVILKSFKKEAEILKNIHHPGLPEYYKFFHYKGKFYIVMEFIEGITLDEMLQSSEEPPEERDVLAWGIQLCEILFYLHTLSPEPVIYRDLKPANIIKTPGKIRLIDFGIARRYDPGKNIDTIRLGTPGYAAPEQYGKRGQSTPRTDIYALGVVLHQLLTLHDPSMEPFKLPPIRKFNSEMSEQLEWIIKKATSLDPRERYLDMMLFREELLDYYRENFGPFYSPYNEELVYSNVSKPLIEQKNSTVKKSPDIEIPESTNTVFKLFDFIFKSFSNLSEIIKTFKDLYDHIPLFKNIVRTVIGIIIISLIYFLPGMVYKVFVLIFGLFLIFVLW